MVNPNELGSGTPGSPSGPAPSQDQGASAGQPQKTGDASGSRADVAKGEDTAKSYDELQQRFGQQGQELGEYRQFFQNIAPLLDKLDQAPELVQAIVDGKVDKNLAKAVLDGRVDIKDAEVVQKVHDDVKKDMGKKAYDKATPDEIQKIIESRLGEFRAEIDQKADLRTFQENTQNFIQNTPDFEKYAEEIDKWIDEHDVTDIEVAYWAVKGKLSEKEAKKAADEAAADRAKDLVADASGGGQGAQGIIDKKELVDKLIAGRPNPNQLF